MDLWLKSISMQPRLFARRGEVSVDSEIASEQTYSGIDRGLVTGPRGAS
jgi:hypothetical protein